MNESDPDSSWRFTAQRVAELSRRVEFDLSHKARLREELLRRHQELNAERTQRPAHKLWPRFASVKRLTLVAPLALAAAVSFSILFWAAQVSGHRPSQSAEAARLTSALVHTVPTVTSWRVSQHLERGSTGVQCGETLQPTQRVYFASRGGVYKAFYYSDGHWYQITDDGSTGTCPSNLMWAFALLATHLSSRDVHIAPGPRVNGHATDRITYRLSAPSGRVEFTTAWVDHSSGLLRRLERNIQLHGTTTRVVAEYRYQYQSRRAS